MLGFDRVPEAALEWANAGKGVALATVVETWGSAPRPVGSQLAISGDAQMVGSVSGGCVEGAVVAEALDALESGQCTVLEFGVADEEAFAVGLACGGRIRVMVEPIGVGQGPSLKIIDKLAGARANRLPIAYRVDLGTWERALIGPEDPVAAEGFRNDKSSVEGKVFTGIHNPPLRMAVVGAVHIAQPLSQIARLAGFDVTIIDPRESFGSAERFPDDVLVHDWPDEAMMTHGLDARTAVVTLTHDPKLDNPAIEVVLRSDIFYLGCLGSKKTHAKRVAHLTEAGFSEAEIARIHGPIGADIGAKSPAEIAISIMAQITERLRRPDTRPGG